METTKNKFSYAELKWQDAPEGDYFFAFSNADFDKKAKKLEGKGKIYDAGMGMYGTKEGISKFFEFYADLKQKKQQCDPQEVYDYEYRNNECEYVGYDGDAMEVVMDLFTEEQVKTIKRKKMSY